MKKIDDDIAGVSNLPKCANFIVNILKLNRFGVDNKLISTVGIFSEGAGDLSHC